jgi:type VI protein secretion system component VasK
MYRRVMRCDRGGSKTLWDGAMSLLWVIALLRSCRGAEPNSDMIDLKDTRTICARAMAGSVFVLLPLSMSACSLAHVRRNRHL